MKYTFLALSLSLMATNAFSGTVKAWVCYSQCLGTDLDANTLYFLGEMDSVGETRLSAWRELSKRCQRKATRNGVQPILAKGSVMFSSDTSYGGSSESSSYADAYLESVRSFGYRSVSAGASAGGSSSSSYYQNDEVSLRVDLNNANNACSQEDVDPYDMIPEYDGDRPILG